MNMPQSKNRTRCFECAEWLHAEVDPAYDLLGADFHKQQNAPRYCAKKNMYIQPLCFCTDFKRFGSIWERLISIDDLARLFQFTEKHDAEIGTVNESIPSHVISKVEYVRDANGNRFVHKVFQLSSHGEIPDEPTWIYNPEELIQFLMFTCAGNNAIQWRAKE